MRWATLLLALPLVGFVPYDHEGAALLPMDDAVVQGRALFNTEVSAFASGVVVQARVPLAGGGHGYLTLDVALGPIGQEAAAEWTYYEKRTASTIDFEAQVVIGQVVIADRFEQGPETSLRLVVDATFEDGANQRVIEGGVLVTAPSPEVLRSHGNLPDGLVVSDGGSATVVVGPGYAYDRGDLDCYGATEEVVIVEDDEPYYEEEIYYDDEVVYDDVVDEDMDCSGSTDESSDYDYDDTSTSDCEGDSEVDTSSSSSDFDCVGDASAATGTLRAIRAPLPIKRSELVARRIVRLSPMLLLLLGLLIARERTAG